MTWPAHETYLLLCGLRTSAYGRRPLVCEAGSPRLQPTTPNEAWISGGIPIRIGGSMHSLRGCDARGTRFQMAERQRRNLTERPARLGRVPDGLDGNRGQRILLEKRSESN
jgi:hypothetical protein